MKSTANAPTIALDQVSDAIVPENEVITRTDSKSEAVSLIRGVDLNTVKIENNSTTRQPENKKE